MQEMIDIAKALSDENRVRVLMMLSEGELCVCQIIEMLGLAPSTVSKHMHILRQAGLVKSSKQGRWMHYKLTGKNAPAYIKQALRWILSNLKNAPKIVEDRKKLVQMRKVDKEDLCKRQRKN
jgi:DNA-binding transcriptional ArsR family regulator